MYEYIKGTLAEKNPVFAVIDANGVGYNLQITLNTYSRLKDGEICLLYTHLVVREDAHILFGFAEPEERELFRQLITVSGVGANTARLILSSLSHAEVIQAIAMADAGLLQRIKGIGAKTAQRIIVDLKDKVVKKRLTIEKVDFMYNTSREEALSGLIILGFPKMHAEKALAKVIEKEGTDVTVEHMIKQALKIL
jgi:Holliday junction DNA helicase RuvA